MLFKRSRALKHDLDEGPCLRLVLGALDQKDTRDVFYMHEGKIAALVDLRHFVVPGLFVDAGHVRVGAKDRDKDVGGCGGRDSKDARVVSGEEGVGRVVHVDEVDRVRNGAEHVVGKSKSALLGNGCSVEAVNRFDVIKNWVEVIVGASLHEEPDTLHSRGIE